MSFDTGLGGTFQVEENEAIGELPVFHQLVAAIQPVKKSAVAGVADASFVNVLFVLGTALTTLPVESRTCVEVPVL